MSFKLFLNKEALQDIQDAIDFYEEQETSLGKKFIQALNKHFSKLQKNPFYNIRYDKVRCLPLKKFPYMIHYTVDEEAIKIVIRAVFHTSRSPKNWKKR